MHFFFVSVCGNNVDGDGFDSFKIDNINSVCLFDLHAKFSGEIITSQWIDRNALHVMDTNIIKFVIKIQIPI